MSPRESRIVLPELSDSSAASSALSCSIRSASLNMIRPRSAASIRDHGPVSSALRATRTAASTSFAVACATLATTSPVAGFSVSNVPPSEALTHSLLIMSLVCRTVGLAAGRVAVVAMRCLSGREVGPSHGNRPNQLVKQLSAQPRSPTLHLERDERVVRRSDCRPHAPREDSPPGRGQQFRTVTTGLTRSMSLLSRQGFDGPDRLLGPDDGGLAGEVFADVGRHVA